MLRKLEAVRRRLADVEDSSRVRGERLLEAAKDNDRLRAEVEEHLRTIEGQKDLIATYLVRIAELETQVTTLTDSTRKLTEANEVLADSLQRHHVAGEYGVVCRRNARSARARGRPDGGRWDPRFREESCAVAGDGAQCLHADRPCCATR